MKKIILLSLVLGLIGINGCSKVEKESKEAVLSTLKDPDSAQFQNIKGYCGEVNSKNSYGGYVGFKRYVSIDGGVLMEDSEGVEPETFAIIWEAHCTPNKLSLKERNECVKDAYNQSLIMDARLKGVSKESLRNEILADKKAPKAKIEEGLRDIDRAYNSNFKDKGLYAQDVVAKCVKLID
ncbi:TPA: hypothetical protein ACSIRU_003761 [Acinetobacter baumannii]|uniref:hypothetical protein n=1 Tax=Acinetobacter baumannii TaxID=470 RepID=UPI001D194892|nr:hypothetical protein [Acinetobacter baumannii]